MFSDLKCYLKMWDWRLFLFILLFLGLPNVYQLYRVHLIGNELPDPGSLAIVSQWQFVGLVVEVFPRSDGPWPSSSSLAHRFVAQPEIQLDRAKSVFVLIFGASLLFSVGVFIFRDAFITLIGTAPDIQSQTAGILRN